MSTGFLVTESHGLLLSGERDVVLSKGAATGGLHAVLEPPFSPPRLNEIRLAFWRTLWSFSGSSICSKEFGHWTFRVLCERVYRERTEGTVSFLTPALSVGQDRIHKLQAF